MALGGESEGDRGYRIYVQEGAVLNDRNKEAYTHNETKSMSKKLPKGEDDRIAVTKFMCDTYYDIRTFGAVMTTEVNCGLVRGPVQLCFSRSVEPVLPQEMGITRMAVTNEKDAEKERTMGRKQYIPYGLYRLEGFVSAPLAAKSGFSQEDLDLLWEALMNMFECDRSSSHGLMTSRRLVVFKHDSTLGNAASRSLFDLVTESRVTEGPARSYGDYSIDLDAASLPRGVVSETFEDGVALREARLARRGSGGAVR